MDLAQFLQQSTALDARTAKTLAQAWHCAHTPQRSDIIQQGAVAENEIILLDGFAASLILDPEGREICVGLFVGPCAIPPQISRSRAGQSLVTLSAVTDCLIAQLPADALTELMVNDAAIRQWGQDILRAELLHKADREWCLAALGGADRLAWFRKRFPRHEDHFPHTMIASFLGMTPVTLSRLRNSPA